MLTASPAGKTLTIQLVVRAELWGNIFSLIAWQAIVAEYPIYFVCKVYCEEFSLRFVCRW